MLLSIVNTTGPMLRLSLDPAIHCTNVLFSVLQSIKNSYVTYSNVAKHYYLINLLLVSNFTQYISQSYFSKYRITDIEVTTKYVNYNVA